MIKSCLAIIVGIAVTIVAEVPANAAGMTYLPGGDAATILLTGEIVEGDAEALRVALRRAAERGHSIQGLNLNSVGGSVFEGINIVRIVHAANLNTAVLSGATCASICFLAFAAGHMKFADLKSRVGVHAASGEFGQDNSASRAGTAAMSRIAQRLRVPARIVGWMMQLHRKRCLGSQSPISNPWESKSLRMLAHRETDVRCRMIVGGARVLCAGSVASTVV